MSEAFIWGSSGFIALYFLRLNRNNFYSLALASVGLLDDILKTEDDDEKLIRVQRKTKELIVLLIKVFILIFVCITIFLIWIFFFELILSIDLNKNNPSIIAFSVGASIPFLLPIKNSSSYSEVSQLFHKLTLDNPNLGLRLLQREIKKYSSKSEKKEKFLIVSGLARSGTTSMMNALSKNQIFDSLSYSNMPFLLSPKTWGKVYRPSGKKRKERRHGDGIFVNENSNEALEEYFFKSILKDSFITSSSLVKHALSEESYELYLRYQGLISASPKRYYLAKNNNMLLRYESLRNFNKNFIFLLLFRDPLSHAFSLYQMHNNFSSEQEKDPFIIEYMNWLVHHEFGLNHKYFDLDKSKLDGDKSTLNYWLKIWINFYRYAEKIKDANTYFICYETYCEKPNFILSKILKKFNNPLATESKPYLQRKQVKEKYSAKILNEAMIIYNKLKNKEL